jgi:hypothetical protein
MLKDQVHASALHAIGNIDLLEIFSSTPTPMLLWERSHRCEFARRRSPRHRSEIKDDQKGDRKACIANHNERIGTAALGSGIIETDFVYGSHRLPPKNKTSNTR